MNRLSIGNSYVNHEIPDSISVLHYAIIIMSLYGLGVIFDGDKSFFSA